jgi:hypothetical protein
VVGAVFGDHIRMTGAKMTTTNTAAAVLCATMLCACHRDESPAPPSAPTIHMKAPVVAKAGPNAEQLTAGMVQAASQGKSPVDVDLKFELVQRPTLGQPLEINLDLIPQLVAGPVVIQITGADGLDLAADSRQFEIPSVESGEVYRHTLTMTPSSEGLLILTVTVAVKHDDATDLRVFSIPVIAER